MKALDIIKTLTGSIGFIKETDTGGQQAKVIFIKGLNEKKERSEWWSENELKVIDSIPRLIAMAMCHPDGDGKEDVKQFFKINNE